MIFKIFIYAENKEDALNKVQRDFLNVCDENDFSIDTVKEYWKIDGAYEVSLVLVSNRLESMMNYYAKVWQSIGNPIEEYIVSNTMYGVDLKSDYLMINIFCE